MANDRLVIGKIPGYNKKIQKTGKKSPQYDERLKNNLTRVILKPTGYNILFGSLPEGVKESKVTDTTLGKATTDVTQLYHIGPKENSGLFGTKDALAFWEQIVHSAYPKDDKTRGVNQMEILCTNDSTMTEAFGNDYGISTIEELANKLGNTKIGQSIQTIKKGVTFDSQAGLKLLETKNSMIEKNQFLNLIAGKTLGIQTALPKEWKSSSYTNSLQLMIKLVSPSGDPESIKEYILKPMQFLIMMTAPITFNGITYGYPPIFDVQADGMMNIKLGVISNMTITRGGNETQFNRFNQPLNIDVRLTIDPLVNGYATPIIEDNKLSISDLEHFLVTNPKMLRESFKADSTTPLTDDDAQYNTIKL